MISEERKRKKIHQSVTLLSAFAHFSAPGDEACLFLEGRDGMETRLVRLKVLQSGVKVAEVRFGKVDRCAVICEKAAFTLRASAEGTACGSFCG